jgi:hypothetical protein
MKKFLVSLALLFSASAFSSAIDVSKLNSEQVAQVQAQVAKMSSTPENISATVRTEAEAWGTLGANMGKAMVGAAREVGVASNEFASTSLGKVVVGIVAYKIIGKDVLGVIFGTLILLVGYSLAVWLLMTKRWSTVEYKYEPIFWGMVQKQYVTSIRTDSDVATGKIIASMLLLALTTIVGIQTIF